MINYREIIKDEEIKLQNLYLETKNIIYLHYYWGNFIFRSNARNNRSRWKN